MKLTQKQSLVLDLINKYDVKEFSFTTNTYHTLEGRISVSRKEEFELKSVGQNSNTDHIVSSEFITSSELKKSERFSSLLYKANDYNSISDKSLYNILVQLEKKTGRKLIK